MNPAALRPLGLRWFKFNAVGAVGIVVQLGVLAALASGLGVHYLAATLAAVEAAILHNFFWHERWTWRERTHAAPGAAAICSRLLRFQISNGVISILANLVLMRLLVGELGVHYLAANLLSIAGAAAANFLSSEFFVFRASRP